MPDGLSCGTKLQAAFELLLEGCSYAQDLQKDIWQFAVEAKSLSAVGLLPNDFRWLVWKGYVQFAREVTTSSDQERVFEANEQLIVSDHTCFVLTEPGVAAASEACKSGGSGEIPAARDGTQTIPPVAEAMGPKWDEARRELTLGGRLVKRFRLPSPNQELVLMAFEEEGWPASIDDPLPPCPGQDSKRRLQATLKALNSHQKHPLIRFKGNGTGEGVLWEPLIETSNGEPG